MRYSRYFCCFERRTPVASQRSSSRRSILPTREFLVPMTGSTYSRLLLGQWCIQGAVGPCCRIERFPTLVRYWRTIASSRILPGPRLRAAFAASGIHWWQKILWQDWSQWLAQQFHLNVGYVGTNHWCVSDGPFVHNFYRNALLLVLLDSLERNSW